jgi:single-stranded DNA-binding protein
MPRNNTVHVRGEVTARPYFDMVPNRKTGGRIAFFKVLLDCPRDNSQPRDDRHESDRIRVVAYGKLAEALRGKVKPGDWMVVDGWVQIRTREDGEAGVAQTLAEIIALEVDHFMKPFVPGSELMDRIEHLAETRGESARELLTRLMTAGVVQLERDSYRPVAEVAQRSNGNGAHA